MYLRYSVILYKNNKIEIYIKQVILTDVKRLLSTPKQDSVRLP